MRCSDGHFYVVKFRNNPQHLRVLANEMLGAMLIEQPSLFHSARLLGEMKTFVRHADGHGSASEGAHDDCVMAMAIALGVRREDSGRVRRRAVEVGSLVVGRESASGSRL